MCNCGVLLLKQLLITSCVADFIQFNERNSLMVYINEILLFRTLQLLTGLLYGSDKFALNINKEIIRLTISYLKASERFAQPLFWPTTAFIFFLFFFYLFICYSFMSYCTGLTVSDYTLLEFCVLFRPVLGTIFHIHCFIISFIVSACKDPWYIYIKKIIL